MNARDKELLWRFLVRKLNIQDRGSWAMIVDWLREIHRGQQEYFLQEFPGSGREFRLLRQLILGDAYLERMISDANALVQRSAMVVGAQNAETAHNQAMITKIITIVTVLRLRLKSRPR
jgi:hypothetical protein